MPGQCLVPVGVGGSRVPQAESTSVDARHLYRVASGDGRYWPDRAVCSASLRGGSGRTLIRDQICPNSIGQFQGALEIDTACGSLFSPGIPWTLHLKIDSGPGQSPPNSLFSWTGDTPGPLARAGLRLGPRLRRPAVQPPSRPRASPLDLSEVRGPGRVPGSAARPSLFLQPKGCLPLETRNRTIDINHKNR